MPEFVQAVSASTVTTVATTAAGAEALLACEGLEALSVGWGGRRLVGRVLVRTFVKYPLVELDDGAFREHSRVIPTVGKASTRSLVARNHVGRATAWTGASLRGVVRH